MAPETHAPLAAMYAAIGDASPDRPFVVAQLGQSLDGRIATLTGASRSIGGDAALDHLHRLRASVDAVVVGVGTVLADDPRLTVRRVHGVSPVRVVIDPNGRMPLGMNCTKVSGECLRIAGKALPGGAAIETIAVPCDDSGLDPHAIVSALFARGLKRLLIEGGATTVSRFIDAQAVDRLHVVVAPVILGSGLSGLSLKPIAGLEGALRPKTAVHVLPGGDVVFDCQLK